MSSKEQQQPGSPAMVFEESCDGKTVTYYHIRRSRAADICSLGAIERSAGNLFRTIEGLEAIADDEPMAVRDLTAIHDAGLLWVAVGREGPAVVAMMMDDDEDNDNDNDEQREENLSNPPPVETVVGFLAVFTIKAPPTTPPTPPTTSSSSSSPQKTSPPSDESFFLHIAELSVHASHQRRGLARSLMTHLALYAEDMNSTSTRPTPGPDSHSNSNHSNSNSTPTPRALGLTLTTYHDVPFNGPVYDKMGFKAVARNGIDVEKLFGSKAREIWDREQRDIAVPEGRIWMVRWLAGLSD